MPQEAEKVTTALISASICKAAKVYAAKNDTSIRAVIDAAVSAFLKARGQKATLPSVAGASR